MNFYRQGAALMLVAVLTIGASYASLHLARGNELALNAAAERLPQVPQQFGRWKMDTTHDLDKNNPQHDLDRSNQQILECAGSMHRVYRHVDTGQTINMFMIVGPPGPTSVHSPEICYSGQGFEPDRPTERLDVHPTPDARQQFWQATLKSSGPTPQQLRVAYGWNAGAGWVAPDNPRFAFGGKPLLYKLQMATTGTAEAGADGFHGFLNDFLPVLDASLFSSKAD